MKCVAVSAVYSPIDFDERQEELVRAIIQQEIPGIPISISKEVANLGETTHSRQADMQDCWNERTLRYSMFPCCTMPKRLLRLSDTLPMLWV